MKKKCFQASIPAMFLLFLTIFIKSNMTVEAEIYPESTYGTYLSVECTAYCETGNNCADGTYPVEGITVAGKKEWLGKTCIMYAQNEDGSVGDLIGIYEFHDTGYGRDTDGDGVGDIQAGQTIDLYFQKEADCWQWGRQQVYIQIVDAQG